MEPADNSENIEIQLENDQTARIALTGNWKMHDGLPGVDDVLERLSKQSVQTVVIEGRSIGQWDSSLLSFVLKLKALLGKKDIQVKTTELPDGIQGLLSLAAAVPERKGARREDLSRPFLERLGKSTVSALASGREMVSFIGEASTAFVRLLKGKARFRPADFMEILHDCGPGALPIVSLISVLVGLILAFVGAVQLEMFGAEIYVADLVGLGMAREMSAMMSAVIMAGRTGAAFAARLGTMQVNEEIDALTTLGISPMEFLVLPRLMALMLMMPLLCLYANLMGIIGGAVVSVTMMDINPAAYFYQTRDAVALSHFAVGLIKSVVFGVIVALSGCLKGIQCGRSSQAVGQAATSAVVTAIVFIVVSDALLTVMFDIIGI